MISNKKSFTIAEAHSKAQSYCAYQDRCHKEVTQKLRDLGMIPQSIDHIISDLIKDNFLNEERFSRSFARGKFRVKSWGRVRIKRELKMRNISEFNIKYALQEIEEDYLTAFETLAEKKWDSFSSAPLLKRKKKLLDYLQYRGWESQLIYDKINSLSRTKFS